MIGSRRPDAFVPFHFSCPVSVYLLSRLLLFHHFRRFTPRRHQLVSYDCSFYLTLHRLLYVDSLWLPQEFYCYRVIHLSVNKRSDQLLSRLRERGKYRVFFCVLLLSGFRRYDPPFVSPINKSLPYRSQFFIEQAAGKALTPVSLERHPT